METTDELDIDELDAALYNAWQALQKKNYGQAQTQIAAAWRDVRLFRLSLDDRKLPGTEDTDIRAMFLKAIYWLRNLRRLPCSKLGYSCEWVYPYGFVPEGGCPIHDR